MGQFITAYDQFFIDDGRQYEYYGAESQLLNDITSTFESLA